MRLSFTVGGAQGTFETGLATEVAGVLDNAFGAEGEWEGVAPRRFGDMSFAGWADLQRRAEETLGREAIPNLLALDEAGHGVYVPAHVQAVRFPLSQGHLLRCASLPGLRAELAELADRWELPLDDDGLLAILGGVDETDDLGELDEAPEVVGFARLALAANEAVRRDCPLWIVG